MSRSTQDHARGFLARLRVGEILALTIGGFLFVALLGAAFAISANSRVNNARVELIDHVAPAADAALSLDNALINQETGIRGFILSGERSFLFPYRQGVKAETQAYADLRGKGPIDSQFATRVDQLEVRMAAWRLAIADPALHPSRYGNANSNRSANALGKARFDQVRVAIASLQDRLQEISLQSRKELKSAANGLDQALLLIIAVIIASVLGAGFLMQRIVTAPLGRLRSGIGRVSAGQFNTTLSIGNAPRDIAAVAMDVEQMRTRIVSELAAVEAARTLIAEQSAELTRSNADLEQFAYVASHDLQEPLRKVASFSQILERRYAGQLDERADQYIDFIVDGAKRMQILINELLAFSRVGRNTTTREVIDMNALVDEAKSTLSTAIQAAQATINVGELPAVQGDFTLLSVVVRNLLGNAVKFRGDEPPIVSFTAEAFGDQWQFTCADNGIGIDPQFGERIFDIFQRLHPTAVYSGTGIGLAMCRKIIEYHGGRIWLDADHSGGASFHFTLPLTSKI